MDIVKNNITIIYLIRHSDKFDPNKINTYNSQDSNQLKTEKKMLSVEGEEKAKLLSQKDEFKDINSVYCSNYVRAMQTAKYFIEKNNLSLNIDERFNERKYGTPDYEKNPNFYCLQYWNKDVKALDGESQREVNNRMTEAFWEVAEKKKNKRVL